ncbi:MAG: c-type cytochrome [Flavobacteriaceae bacterium]|jgi:mono/diheme cytochrome c family protein|tara:strand:- start:342 stop:731 length:390 start_codon:yes stop_codon:yes gene_type:complete
MRFIFLIILLSTSSLAQQSSGDSYMRGQMLYVDFCVRCHLPDGTGETGLIPPLANADFLQDIQATVQSIKYGIHGPITVNGVIYNNTMAPMGLENDEIADVTNYILNSWGNSADVIVTEAYVRGIKETK